MGWDYGQRRASRYCLFPLKHIGVEYRAGRDNPFEIPEEVSDPDEWEEWEDPTDQPSTCGANDTDHAGLCPLHQGMPYKNMTPEGWEHLKTAIDARRTAARAIRAAEYQVRAVKQKRASAKTDKWRALVAAINAREQVNWARVTREHRQHLARQGYLPDWVALALLDVLTPEDGTEIVAVNDWGHDIAPDADTLIRCDLAAYPNDDPPFSDEVVAVLFNDPHPLVRACAAKFQRPRTEEQEMALLDDPYTFFPWLHNVDCPYALRESLGRGLLDPGSGWARSVGAMDLYQDSLGSWDTPFGLTRRLGYRVPRSHVRGVALAALLSRDDASGTLIDEAVRSDLLDYSTLATLAAHHPNITSETLDYLAKTRWKTVRDAVDGRRARERTS